MAAEDCLVFKDIDTRICVFCVCICVLKLACQINFYTNLPWLWDPCIKKLWQDVWQPWMMIYRHSATAKLSDHVRALLFISWKLCPLEYTTLQQYTPEKLRTLSTRVYIRIFGIPVLNWFWSSSTMVTCYADSRLFFTYPNYNGVYSN